MSWEKLPNLYGFFAAGALLLWFPLCGYVGYRLTRKVKPAPIEDKPDAVAPAPLHVHILDLERSDPTVTDIGGVLARCVVAGCEESVYIAPSLARSYVGEALELRR